VKVENTTGTGLHVRVGAIRRRGGGTINAGSNDGGHRLREKGAIEKATHVGKGSCPLDHFYRMKIDRWRGETHDVPQQDCIRTRSPPRTEGNSEPSSLKGK